MARYDKYNGMTGGFRAPLAAAITSANQIGTPLAVGLDANGRAVIGGGATGVVGVYVADQAKVAGDIADIMTSGEIVEVTGLAAGTKVGGNADGSVAAGGTTPVGYTVEATRLIVRVAAA